MSAAGRAPVSGLLLAAVSLGALAAGGLVLLAAWSVLAPASTQAPQATAPAGAASEAAEADGWAAWDHNDDGRPVRWDPCSPIDVVVNEDGAYTGFRADLDTAIDEVRELTGLQIRVLGDVDERPHPRRPVHQPDRYGDDWAPVLIAFAEAGENELPLLHSDRGLASPVAVGPDGDRVYVTGQVVLNAERDDLVAGSDDRADAWGATLRHELGHLLGLAHVDDERQLMYPHATDAPVAWGHGDRRGLAALGAGGCLEVPDAQPVDVEMGPVH
jgi:hypothetical protein